MTKKDLNNILQRLLEKRLEWTKEEKQWMLEYLEDSDTGELRLLLEESYQHQPVSDQSILPEEILFRLHEKIKPDLSSRKGRVIRMKIIRIAAACLVGVLFTAVVLWKLNDWKLRPHELSKTSLSAQPVLHDIPPGESKAVLILGDGSTIELGNARNGALVKQGNTNIQKLNGKISYDAQKISTVTLYNTVTTPRGGQFEVQLPDGSMVWLNAASSIRFPAAFNGNDRRVAVTGEVYFEVSQHPDKPFFVTVGNAEVQVLGTHFNIMSYADEISVKTTLLEGSLRFVDEDNSSLLVPGQQAELNNDGVLKVKSHVDTEEVIAWKNGFFHFEGADIHVIMRQLSRWYDVEVSYKNISGNNLFYADIPRNTNLSDALKALTLTGKVHFEIQGKNITVVE